MKDITIYNDRMRKSLMDKIFFVDKVDATVFVDFGCADGSMIKMLNSLFPEYYYVGYDNNPEMIKLADANVNSVNTAFYSDWDRLSDALNEHYMGEKKCLILSSVLHEVENKEQFFEFLKFGNFDYVAIRDMMYEQSSEFKSNFIVDELFPKIPDRIKYVYGPAIWKSYNMVQAAFKSYYKENLDTELLEDYFSFDANHLLTLRYKYKLNPVYEYHYLLPYWKQTIKGDFGVDLSGIKTHVQLIYEVNR